MSETAPPLLEGATRDLAAFGAELRYEDIPSAVVDRLKLSLLDSIGCCLYGATLPWTRRVADMALAEGAKPVAALFGLGRKTSIALAALVNGTAGHAFELDDIHKESILHPGSIATPIAFAYAERGDFSGKEFLTAMAAGYELGVRVGNGATSSLFFRGFHPQGTSGVYVAAATAARALGLDAAQFQHALGIVGSQAGGLMAAQEGAMVKRLHSGRAAQSGVYSAELARTGFTGIQDVLEASYGGYLTSYSDKPNAKRLTDGLGRDWETLNIGYKSHASVTSIHTSQDGLAAIMREQGLKPHDIAKIAAGLSRLTHVHCAWDYKPRGVTAAQMNLYFGLAVIAVDGVAFTDQYREDRLRDPQLLSFISRVTASIDPEIEALGNAYRHSARIVVTTVDGRRFEKLIHDRRGSPESPLSPADIEAKFRAVARSCLSPAHVDRVVNFTQRADQLPDLKELIAMLAAPPVR